MSKNKLKAAMALKGETQKALAEKLGMKTASLNYRINGRVPFKANEIERLAKILGLTGEEIITIFFSNEVDKMPTEEEQA